MNKTFSLKVKEEIVTKEFKSCCLKKFLNSIIKYNFKIINNKLVISFLSEIIVLKVKEKLEKLYNDISILINKAKKINKYEFYNLEIKENFYYFLKDLKIFDEKKNPINKIEFKNKHCKRAYLAGIFISIGSVNPPTTTYYHLEFNFKNKNDVDDFLKLTNEFNFKFKTVKRNKRIICYIKKSTLISDFLKLIDASNSVLEFENIRIERDFVNNINRLNNMDVLNYKKVIKASDQQIKMIKFLSNKKILETLNVKIKYLAKLRLENENANLNELSQLMYKRFNIKITKPGINHLFRKIKKIYLQELNNKNQLD